MRTLFLTSFACSLVGFGIAALTFAIGFVNAIDGTAMSAENVLIIAKGLGAAVVFRIITNTLGTHLYGAGWEHKPLREILSTPVS